MATLRDGHGPRGAEERAWALLGRNRLQVENLGRDVAACIGAADECPDLPTGDLLDRSGELGFAGVLEEHPDLPNALMLPEVDHVPLGRGEAVLDRGQDRVWAGICGPRLGGSASE